jgi:prepilin-type N-terminal cleavage/methylation domain-containing protein
MRNTQSGFTLVEIAIVLVIIGLLLGGVLKGQELITQAKIRNIANDLNGMTAAVYAYQDRYKAFPGDDINAATRWTNPQATKGDGNAQVGATGNSGIIDCSAVAVENCQFWHHLRLSGLIGGDTSVGPGKLSPQNAVGGVLQVQQGALGLSGLVVCTTNLPGKIANAIDAQFDDGKPDTGTVRGQDDPTKLDTAMAAGSAYVDDGAKVYVVCKSI